MSLEAMEIAIDIAAQGSLSLVMHLCLCCSHSLCIKLPWPTLLTIRYLIYIYLSVTP